MPNEVQSTPIKMDAKLVSDGIVKREFGSSSDNST